ASRAGPCARRPARQAQGSWARRRSPRTVEQAGRTRGGAGPLPLARPFGYIPERRSPYTSTARSMMASAFRSGSLSLRMREQSVIIGEGLPPTIDADLLLHLLLYEHIAHRDGMRPPPRPS